MSRLYDRLIRGGLASYGRPGSEYELYAAQDAAVLEEAQVVSADEPVRYFYEVAGDERWWTGAEFANLAPPFDHAFVETRRPRAMTDRRGRTVAEPREELPAWWGALIVMEDLKRAFVDRDGDRWPEAAGRAARAFFAQHAELNEADLGEAGFRSETGSPVRWIVSLSVYLEPDNNPVGRVRGPVGRVYLAVDEWGRLMYLADGRRARFAVPAMDLSGDPGLASEVGNLLGYLTNPLLFSVSLFHCEGVEAREMPPTRHERRQAEREGGPPPVPYHEIHFEPMRRVIDEVGRARELGLKRALEEVRGHWRYYHPDRPLFGRTYTGWLWISQHTRGEGSGDPAQEPKAADYRIAGPTSRPKFKRPPEPPSRKQRLPQQTPDRSGGLFSALARLLRRGRA